MISVHGLTFSEKAVFTVCQMAQIIADTQVI